MEMESLNLTSLQRRFLKDLLGTTSLVQKLESNGCGLRPGTVKLRYIGEGGQDRQCCTVPLDLSGSLFTGWISSHNDVAFVLRRSQCLKLQGVTGGRGGLVINACHVMLAPLMGVRSIARPASATTATQALLYVTGEQSQ